MAIPSALEKPSGASEVKSPEEAAGPPRPSAATSPVATPAAWGVIVPVWRFLNKKFRFFSIKSLRAKVLVHVLLLLVVTTLVSFLIAIRIMNQQILGEIVRKGESLSRSIASASGYNLLSHDVLGLDNMVYRIRKSNPDINFIAVLGPEKEIVVHSDIAKTGGRMGSFEGKIISTAEDGTLVRKASGVLDDSLEIESPIRFMDRDLGSVILSVNRSALSKAQAEVRGKAAGFYVVILVAGLVSCALLSLGLTRPIKELMFGVEELKRGKRSHPLRIYSQDELGRLTSSFNEMTNLITAQQSQLGQYARELEQAYVSTIRVLAAAIDARDAYTLGHSTRVSELAVELAREVGLSGQNIEDIEIACLFHDVGKIRIRDSILHKRGRLTPAEFAEMKKHAEYGAEILSKAPSLYKFIPAVRHHHEWYNGSGYPDGLSGEQIPKSAAVICLADAYDAMTSNRPYRKAMSGVEALRTIKEFSEKQFHPVMVAAFLRVIRKKNLPISVASHTE
jgi:putative nucleotidyltransferase with HDIG domain